MISSVLELFGCEQQKTMLRGVGERQESRRFSSGRDRVLFTIATEKSNSAGEGAVQLQGSKQGENTDTHRVLEWDGVSPTPLKRAPPLI